MSAPAHSGGVAESTHWSPRAQGKKAIHHLELAGPLTRRVMFRKGKSRGGVPAGQRAEVSIFYIQYFNIYIFAMEIKRGQRDT